MRFTINSAVVFDAQRTDRKGRILEQKEEGKHPIPEPKMSMVQMILDERLQQESCILT
jgi:hypothetical protein